MSYSYRYLCMPSVPCLAKDGVAPPIFLGPDEPIGLFTALLMGLQHALAVVLSIATSGGLLIAGDACFAWQRDSMMCASKAYLVSAAWITSGLLTTVQVFRAKLLDTGYYLGTGLISIMGTSFTFLPIARDMVVSSIAEAKMNGECDGMDCPEAGFRGYGRFLGTCMVAALLEVAIAMLPPRVLRRLFPPVVTGTALMLIGGGLISSGLKYLGGGVFCADNMLSREAAFGSGPQLCNENGDVVHAFGAPDYVGLGLSVVLCIILIQLMGSPFLKSTALFWGFCAGMLVSGVATYEAVAGDKTPCSAEGAGACGGDGLAMATPGRAYSYWNSQRVDEAPWITFLWNTEPNPLGFLGFSGEYLLPLLIGFCISTAESVGDIRLSCEASRITPVGEEIESRVQGGLLADGLNSLIACLFTSPPNTTFSQNNGIISLTGCASRRAGYACAFWLILFGVLGKLGAVVASVPICVVGGLVLVCFAMVFVGGVKVLSAKPLSRRDAFILAIALGFGLGVALVPQLFEAGGGASFYGKNLNHNYGLWPKKETCKRFPTAPHVVWASSCANPLSQYASATMTEEDCREAKWIWTPPETTELPVENCVGSNGACCIEYEDGKKMRRTAAIMVLKTPYCIGTLIAGLLHFLLPHDKGDGEGEDAAAKQLPELHSTTSMPGALVAQGQNES